MTNDEIRDLIEKGIDDQVFPGAVALIGTRNHFFVSAHGNRMITPEKRPMEIDTIFDLASLTKPIVIGTLTMQLVEEKKIKLDQPAKNYLPELRHEKITLLDLLTHRSGYAAWIGTYSETKTNDQVLSFLCEMPLNYPTCEKVIYSCLGYILLGKVIERISDQSLDQLANDRIFRPLGMNETFYNPPSSVIDRCAATEIKTDRHDGIVGRVHDENAFYLDGISGNAGLFSTATDLAKFCRSLIGVGDQIITKQSIDQLRTVHTDGLNSRRGIGWIILRDGSLYHSGFTGTSIRLDLCNNCYKILLTNRVHPDRSNTKILAFRDRFYELE